MVSGPCCNGYLSEIAPVSIYSSRINQYTFIIPHHSLLTGVRELYMTK